MRFFSRSKMTMLERKIGLPMMDASGSSEETLGSVRSAEHQASPMYGNRYDSVGAAWIETEPNVSVRGGRAASRAALLAVEGAHATPPASVVKKDEPKAFVNAASFWMAAVSAS
jgi:hypothetical protein